MRWRSAVWRIAAGETLVWAGIYYSFPALLPRWEAALGWSKAELTGAFTLAVLVSAAAAPLAGRVIDRGHGAALLALGAVAGGALVGLLSGVTEPWQFYALWTGIGLAMAGALYEPCFAFVTHALGADARRAITRITLVAGFAGTVSFPSAHLLAGAFGWRGAVQVFAAVVCLVAAPLLWSGARALGTPCPAPGGAAGAPRAESAVGRALRSPVFWLLAASFSLVGLNHGVLINHLLPLLGERGVEPSVAVLAVSLVGPMQVAGRVAMLGVERRVSIAAVCVTAYLALALASLVLLGAGTATALVLAFVVLQGSGYGVTSITRPVVTAQYLGREGFGVISGVQATVFMASFAVAPTAASLIWEAGGYDAVLAACIALAVAAVACFLAATRLRRRAGG